MRRIPSDIKIEIIRKYLEGHSIPEISNLYNVSVASVSAIITEETKKELFFAAFREISKIIRKKNLNIYDLIPAIHLISKIEELGLTSEFFDKYLDLADSKSFRLNMNLEEFLNKIIDIINFEKSNQIQIHDIPSFSQNEKNLLDKVHREKEMIEKEVNNLCGNIGVMKSQILEYIKLKPLFLRFKENTDAFSKSVGWYTYPPLFEKASNEIGVIIDPDILINKLHFIYENPHKNAELIRIILNL